MGLSRYGASGRCPKHSCRPISGPPVMPPERPGFGTRLIALSVGNDLGGTVEQRFEPTGLVTRIEVPLT